MGKCLFFHSACSTFWERLEEYNIRGFCELISYWEILTHKWSFDKINDLATKRQVVMIDSGAFSAYNSKYDINMADFIKWQNDLTRECPTVWYKAALDVIGSWEGTQKNQEITDAAGLKLFPCYHQQDPMDFLEWIMARKYEYVALGGLVGAGFTNTEAMKPWFDKVYSRLCNPDGTPQIKTHIFGIADVTILHRYPAFSADSATALWIGSYGSIVVPRLDSYSCLPQWDTPLLKLAVSDQSPARGVNGQHYDTLRPPQQAYVEGFCQKLGFDVKQMRNDHELRKVFCLKMLQEQGDHYPEDTRFIPGVKEYDLFG